MGQKNSTSEDTVSAPLTKKESQDLKLKLRKSNQSITENIIPPPLEDVKCNTADACALSPEKPRQLESGDPPIAAGGDSSTEEAASAIRAIDAICRGASSPRDNLNTDALSFALNTSVTDASHLTALRMVRNFEEIVRVNELLQNQLFAMREKSIEDNISEKDFRTISYENLSMDDDTESEKMSLKRDSSTYTNESRELDAVEEDMVVEEVVNVDFNQEGANELSCKEEPKEESSSPEATPDVDDASLDEVWKLKEELDRVGRERDEAQLRLRMAEERCEAYEGESRCLEATLSSMEEKLRTIATELGDEVRKSKNLERQLSAVVFLNSAGP